MSNIYLVRHAESEGNLYRRFHGWYDGPVTPLGMRQIDALTQRFRDIPVDAVCSSDLSRAMATARAAAEPHGLPITPDPSLREHKLCPAYEDQLIGEMFYSYGEQFQAFLDNSPLWAPPGGETFSQMGARMKEAFFRIAGQHPDETVAIFTHSTVIACLQAALRGKEVWEMPRTFCLNTGVSCYEVRGERVRAIYENDASHLTPELMPRPFKDTIMVRIHPMDLAAHRDFYEQARIDAWLSVYPDLLSFDGPGFLQEAAEQQVWDPRSLYVALRAEEPVGVLQLDTLRGAQAGVGSIAFLWVRKDVREKGIGTQLIGQAISTYRAMGRKSLRLRCSPANTAAQRLYAHLGFAKAGTVPGSEGQLDLLEKNI